jgi:hypothetical protein
MQLFEQGHTIEQIAASLRMPVPRTKRYIEEEETARDLVHHRCDQIPAARIRDLYRQRREEDPTLSKAQIARAAGLNRGAVSAAFGHAPKPTRPRAQDRTIGRLSAWTLLSASCGRLPVAKPPPASLQVSA